MAVIGLFHRLDKKIVCAQELRRQIEGWGALAGVNTAEQIVNDPLFAFKCTGVTNVIAG